MKRRTKLNEFGNYVGTNLLDDECLCRELNFDETNEMTAAFNKLGQLEDIDEERGIDSVTLHKICKQGFIYVKNISGEIHSRELSCVDIYTRKIRFIIQYQPDTVLTTRDFKDYGKTWALTKEELE